MPLIHLLTGGPDLSQCRIACGAHEAVYALQQREAVTCPQCRDTLRRRPPAGGMSEKQWLTQVRTLAHTHGWRTYHTLRSQGSEPGWVDLVCLKPPVLVLAELKTTRGRVTPHQQQWLTALQQVTTVTAQLWRPDDWDTVREMLR